MSRYVISLGGSLVAPESGPDWQFLQSFKNIITHPKHVDDVFYIIVGGGNPARQYQNALKELGCDDKTLDHMGIFTTHLNAYYVSLAFNFPPEHKVVLKVERLLGDASLHITGAGLQPGQSSDTVAIQTAIQIQADKVVNLSNISQVYSADPNKDSSASPIDSLTWDEYLNIIPNVWEPGLSTPFDPVASKLAKNNNITVTILGNRLENFEAYLRGDDFIGSVIST